MKCFAAHGQSVSRPQSLRKMISNWCRDCKSKRNNPGTINTPQEDPLENPTGVRDCSQSVDLRQHDDFVVDPSVHSVRLGHGCDCGASVDTCVVMFDDHLRVVDADWRMKLRSTCGGVHFVGSSADGQSGVDDVISVELANVPLKVHHILFSAFLPSRDTSFDEVNYPYARLRYGEGPYKNHEMCRFSPTEMSGHAMLMGVLNRKNRRWNFHALGCAVTGRNIFELLKDPENLNCLKECLPFNGKRTKAIINAVRCIGLSPKESRSLLERSIVSRHYCKITVGGRHFTSAHVTGTTPPVWDEDSFELLWSPAAENERLRIAVFDYDVSGTDDFIGAIDVPVSELFLLDTGAHERRFKLGPLPTEKHKDQAVSGELHLSVQIT